jgi:hypothetical protein
MKTPRFLFVVATVASFLWGACAGPPSTPEPTAAVEQSLQPTVVKPTIPPPTTSPIVPPTGPTQPQYAPFCESAPPACGAPIVTILDTSYCVDKVPYAIMSVQPGTTYETPDLDFQCVDQMHSDGTMRVTCHSVTGKQLWSFDLQFCNSACNTPALQMGTGQCPEGYGYDSAKTCCAVPVPANADGCTVYQVDLGACPDAQ